MLFKLTLIIQLAGLLQLGTAEHWTTSCKTPLNFLNLMSTKTDYNFYANKESDEFNMPGHTKSHIQPNSTNTTPLINTTTINYTTGHFPQWIQLFTLPGCESIGIWHLSRHGARYPDTDDINELNDVLPKLQESILNSNNQWLCEVDKERLGRWQSRLKPEYDTMLTEKGLRQQRELGSRIKGRLPDLMSKIEHEVQVSVKATERIRTQQSANAYVNGFLDNLSEKPSVLVDYEDDYLLKFPDLCSLYQQLVKENKSSCPEVAQFDRESSAYLNVLQTFKDRINTTLNYNTVDLLEYALKMCQYEFLMDSTESIWCKFFDEKMLKTIAYRQDIKYNCKYGYRFEINKLMTCDLVNNLVESLENFKNGLDFKQIFSKLTNCVLSSLVLKPVKASALNMSDGCQMKVVPTSKGLKKANLLFAHSSTVLPFYHAMQIAENAENFDYNDIAEENRDREFKISDLDPMNSNIAFVVYRCGLKRPMFQKFSKYYLKVYRNEKAIRLKACDSEKNCDLRKFIKYYKNFTQVCSSSRDVCQLD